MEIDLAQPDRSSSANPDLFRAEICIIGAGIAGLTLAHRLTALGHDVLLLESGGHAYAAFSAIEQAGHPHPGTSEPRPRALGGTSLTWGGQLLPLPDDAAWPVTSAELAPFTAAAEELLGVNTLPYDAPSFFATIRQAPPSLLAQLPQLAVSLSKFAPFSHRNFAQTLGRTLRSPSKIRIVLHAHVTELLLAPTHDHIEAISVRTPSNKTLRIKAAHTVLAAGTVETVRLLLASRSLAPEGIGNQHDQLGRNFHDHLTVTAATVREPARTQLLTAMRPWIYGSKIYGSKIYGNKIYANKVYANKVYANKVYGNGSSRGTLHSLKLSASRELQSSLNLTPILAHVTIHEPDDSGIGALRSLLRARQQSSLSRTLRNALPTLPRAFADAARLTLSARTQHRRYISPRASVELRLNAAQRTSSASRITLSPGLKPILDWRIDPAELSTLRAFAQHLRPRLERAGLDSLDWNPSLFTPRPTAPIPGLDDARHAMGGAAMGADPRTSVVDANLRVHGIENLFIASAAVFPDGSPQLPTLPLMALTLRLAEHLHGLTR